MPTPGPARSWYSVLGWACYLACSWTWCIGMFLPALLIRDYGPWSFVVFAVPNVIGAAAMGWVLRRPGHAELLTAAHGPAARLFSWVTIAFQAFFFGWMLPNFGVYSLVAALPFLLFSRHSRILLMAASVLVLSLIATAVVVSDRAPLTTLSGRPWGSVPPTDLWLLAPVCLFGFALSPYLDLTFLRARRSLAPAAGVAAFLLGFGVLFAAMIFLTLLYTPFMPLGSWFQPSGSSTLTLSQQVIAAHILTQLVFTIFVHRLEERGDTQHLPTRTYFFLIFAAPMFLGLVGNKLPEIRGLVWNEFFYRLFLSFYGLVFPAYVWLCMLPFRPSLARAFFPPLPPGEGRGERLRAAETLRHGAMSTESADNEPADQEQQNPRPALSNNVRGKARFGASPRAIAVWAIACVLASPLYYLGFVERVEIWLIPGVAIVLLAKLLIPPSERGSWRPPAEPKNAPVPVRSGPPGLSAAAQPER